MSSAELTHLKRRAELNIEESMGVAREIMGGIQQRGDEALIEYVRKFDYSGATIEGLKVTEEEFAQARASVSPEVRAALEKAHRNIRRFHEKQMPEELWFTELDEGVVVGEKITPIASACLYVPRGKGSFPSVMLMLATPARVAGVPRVIVCTPPGPSGEVDAASLVAAELCGIGEIYKLGGAQAIAAVAFGTATVPKVDKVIGPGNTYVSAAKRLLVGNIDVGLPAGPSEAIVLADEHADPRVAALDLLNEAEHGPDSASLLVTHSETLAAQVAQLLPAYLSQLPEWRRAFCARVLGSFGGIVITPDLEASIAFVNEYAPEHLQILVNEPFGVLGRIKNAGEILLGPYASIATSNYCLGLNAILPTGGFARSYSSVSVFDFLKRSGVGYMTRRGMAALGETTALLADYEGFPAHAMAIRKRAEILGQPKAEP
ncbi:MAG TPA: histidinol dehydrogenase [Chloroflexaceae bacterium]|nr:histidinol dehydrogenase [Chloroflexaceae bacterium]